MKLRRAWRALMHLADGTPVSPADMRVIQLGPTDVILIELPGAIRASLTERIQGEMRRIFPNHEVMVMADDMKFRVVTRSQADAVAARLSRANGVA